MTNTQRSSQQAAVHLETARTRPELLVVTQLTRT